MICMLVDWPVWSVWLVCSIWLVGLVWLLIGWSIALSVGMLVSLRLSWLNGELAADSRSGSLLAAALVMIVVDH